ncbi:histidinol-phosphate transaminase [Sphingomonas sp. MMS12-HWE2-04]|uniref:histidinol-phosphate transaminase n=1 Tax=Sphingomonas sp. MMS12-HWE2-04 TaxID=3234199 RepID=UPI00384F6969
MTDAIVLPHVRSIPPYPPGRPIAAVAREFGLDPATIVKLASNESPLGASPAARAALAALPGETALYPDFDCFALREALSTLLDLPTDMILPGTGSSDLFGLAARACLAPGLTAACPQYSFVGFEGAVRMTGATTVITPTNGFVPDLPALAEAARAGARIVYVATPGNPTGALCDPADVLTFLRAVPEDVLVLLDEAYRDYLEPVECVPTKELLAARRNLVILRTFSKIHGLAGLRVGYGLGEPALIAALRGLQTPFAVSSAAEAAAVAALSEPGFSEDVRLRNREWREALRAQLVARGLSVAPSSANFLLVQVGDGAAMFQALMRRGVIVRPVGNYGLADWIRVTIGLPHETDTFLAALDDVRANG